MPEIKLSGWRIAINLLDGTDFNIPVPTRAAAFGKIEHCIAEGYVTVDRTNDSTRYNSTAYPLHQIKSFHVYEVEVEV